MPTIFLSYRRGDTSGYAGRLYDHLVQEFGKRRVFMDIDTLEPGVDFIDALQETLRSSDVLLLLMGWQWTSIADRKGKTRLHDEDDFVRLELERALQWEIRVIPVLVGGAEMPRREELPASIADITRRHAIEISDSRWAYDVKRLTEIVRKVPTQSESKRGGRPRRASARPSRRTLTQTDREPPD